MPMSQDEILEKIQDFSKQLVVLRRKLKKHPSYSTAVAIQRIERWRFEAWADLRKAELAVDNG